MDALMAKSTGSSWQPPPIAAHAEQQQEQDGCDEQLSASCSRGAELAELIAGLVVDGTLLPGSAAVVAQQGPRGGPLEEWQPGDEEDRAAWPQPVVGLAIEPASPVSHQPEPMQQQADEQHRPVTGLGFWAEALEGEWPRTPDLTPTSPPLQQQQEQQQPEWWRPAAKRLRAEAAPSAQEQQQQQQQQQRGGTKRKAGEASPAAASSAAAEPWATPLLELVAPHLLGPNDGVLENLDKLADELEARGIFDGASASRFRTRLLSVAPTRCRMLYEWAHALHCAAAWEDLAAVCTAIAGRHERPGRAQPAR